MPKPITKIPIYYEDHNICNQTTDDDWVSEYNKYVNGKYASSGDSEIPLPHGNSIVGNFPMGQIFEQESNEPKCECGAWSTHGKENDSKGIHSSWCPMFKYHDSQST